MTRLAQLLPIDRSPGAKRSPASVPRLRTRYYAFLSYSHRDKALADWLHRELERFRVPHSLAGRLTANGVVPRRLTPVFRDQQDLSAGADLGEEIKAALAASQFLIVLCSPTAATSRWTNQEIESFKRTRPEGCVLAAVVAGEPFASDLPGREAEECFPPALRYKYDRRGHQTAKRAEPLAADFRAAGEGKRLAFLKLVAGLLGVGLDELVQRDTTRRHRQLAWLASGSLVGMAVAIALAVTAIQARDAARDQRREAEGLVAFMVGDLRNKLESIGRLDALDGVGSRVLVYYKKQDASQLSDDGLMQRSRALNLMAEVAYNRGNFDEAEALYRQAEAGTDEAMRRAPDDTQRLFDHAQNIFWLGELARYRGRSDQALFRYREYKRLGDRLVTLEPDNLRWRMEALYGTENIGISLYNERNYAEATRQFQSALGPIEKLASVDSGNPAYQKELSTVLAWLADASRAQGDLDRAIRARRQQIEILTRAASELSDDVKFRSQLIPAHQALGILLAARGSTEAGIAELRAAVDQAIRLIPVEPANAVWQALAASARLELGKTLLAGGQTDEAEQQATAGCSSVEKALAGDPVAVRTRLSRSECLLLRSRVALARGDTKLAERFAQSATRSAQAENSGDTITDRYRLAAAYRLLGDARQRSGDRAGASAAWQNGLNLVSTRTAERPQEIFEHAQLLTRMGRSVDAEPLAARLRAIGYHSVI